MSDIEVIYQQQVTEVVYQQENTKIVEVGVQGPPGPKGDKGDNASFTTYTFTQSSPATTWTVNHNLGCFPSVEVVDSGGSVVEGGITYVNSNSLILTFSAGFSGFAYLN